MKICGNLFLSNKVFNRYKKIYGEGEGLSIARKEASDKAKAVVMVMCVGLLTAVYVSEHSHTLTEGNRIERGNYGDIDREVELVVTASENNREDENAENIENSKAYKGATNSAGNEIVTRKMRIKVSSRRYTKEETEAAYGRLSEDLPKLILGNNKSLDHVTDNLVLNSSYKGYPFSVTWKTDKPLIVGSDGVIDTKRLDDELTGSVDDGDCVPVIVTAGIRYEDFIADIQIPLAVYKSDMTKSERLLAEVEKSLEAADSEGIYEDGMILPDTAAGLLLTYSEPFPYEGPTVMALCIVVAILICVSTDRKSEDLVKKRDEQMKKDYPGILNKYFLYYRAGMHTKMIWNVICDEYRSQYAKDSVTRYAYEEMLKAQRAMEDGMGERAAYDMFAQNCGLREYRTFVSLVEQAVVKGRDGTGGAFEQEAEEALKGRRRNAAVMGEQAGTKLLLPMFLMLFIVLITVMVPGFVSFRE